MKNQLLWKLLFNVVPVIFLTILVIWLAIDHLAATYFMQLMEHYEIKPYDSHRMFIEAVHRYLLWSALAALGLALLMSYLMTKRVLRPLLQMTQMANNLSAGNFNKRVEVVSADEVGQLGTAFNRMADKLENLETLRRTMVSDLAHELRTPLTNLRGYFEALSDQVLPPTTVTFQMLEQETLHLVNLVDDLQQLAKADAAKAFLHKKDFPLSKLIDQLLPMFQLRLHSRSIQLKIKIEPEDLQLLADFDRMLQVLTNLLDNALRYTPPGGEVTLSGAQRDLSVEIAVINSGEEIAEGDLPFIFERFYRADRSRSRHQGGAGIGLAIVAQIVAAHDGQVGVESAPGQTRFWIKLPRS